MLRETNLPCIGLLKCISCVLQSQETGNVALCKHLWLASGEMSLHIGELFLWMAKQTAAGP